MAVFMSPLSRDSRPLFTRRGRRRGEGGRERGEGGRERKERALV